MVVVLGAAAGALGVELGERGLGVDRIKQPPPPPLARGAVAGPRTIVAGVGIPPAVGLQFAPPVFHSHLQQARLPAVIAQVRERVDEAFDRALLISLAVAVAVAPWPPGGSAVVFS
jgi:hypothetical protein